ncbi:hypothetical protein E1211_24895 [Micromonospora sp. 15K316]|uniref:hypothetical protein n=1 Tax=Micromonospora sp. 15K316 TaxID=2530376 RepID=UPI00104434E7|nr:hypothetical protein [Micromonospora sp. 15K316]TDC30086.1 hypothetical protein E1211_24895 [Micromonospora sp. 15K316]
MIITVTPTIGDGTVVRWYPADTHTDLIPATMPAVSASRNGVLVNTYLHAVPEEVMTAAHEVWEQLRRDHDADVTALATHRKERLFGTYEPVTAKQWLARPEAAADPAPEPADGTPGWDPSHNCYCGGPEEIYPHRRGTGRHCRTAG